MRLLILLAVGVSIALAACGGVESATPTATTVPIKIKVSTIPNPPMVGDVELIFTVVDEKDQPVIGADFDVIADHIEMNGMTMHGKATDQGYGSYAIQTNFIMAGKWRLTVQVRKETLDFKQDIDLDIN